MTVRAQNADLHRKAQIFADSPLLLEIQAFGGRRKPQIFVESQLRHLQLGPIRVNFGSLWGRSAEVTFEPLLGYFNSFCVSVEHTGKVRASLHPFLWVIWALSVRSSVSFKLRSLKKLPVQY